MKNYQNIRIKAKGILPLAFAFVAINLKAQYNLVPNPSFETYTVCPYNPLAPPLGIFLPTM